MEEVIWIEVLSGQRNVVSRQRVAVDTVTIGRAYDNDLVFDDPHMAAHHLRLFRGGDGTWVAEDLGSINRISIDGVRHERVVLDGDTALRIGQTNLRVRTSAHRVAEELPLARAASRWPAALLCLASAFVLLGLHRWLRETGEPELVGYLGPLAVYAMVVAAWVAVWSVLSRVFIGDARSSRHALIFGVGALFFALYGLVSELAAFALSLTVLSAHNFVISWLALAAVCFAHLRALGRTRWPLKAVSVMALAVLGITIQGLQQSADRATSGQSVTLRLEPPALRMVDAQPEAAFFTSAARLRSSLDKARASSR